MKKAHEKVFLRFLSLMMTMAVCTAAVVPAFAQDENGAEKDSAVDSGNPLVVSAAAASGSLDLTEAGTLDWMHVTGKQVNQKKDSEPLIALEGLSADTVTTLSDSPVQYSWSDGSPRQTAAGLKTGGVFNYKSGDPGSVDTDITEDAGYRLAIPAADDTRQMVFVSGIWQAQGRMSVCVDGSDSPVYETDLQAAGTADVKTYTVTVRPGYSVEITCALKRKTNEWGNLSLGGIALSKLSDDGRDYRALTEALLNDARTLDLTDCPGLLKDRLNAEMASSEKLLGDPEAAPDDYHTAYLFLKQAYDAAYAALSDGGGQYMYESNAGLVSSFGWEGDINAPIAYLDGSYKLRSYDNVMVTFGVTDIPGKVKWYNAEGYLPCFISEYSKKDMDYKVENFSDLVVINGNKFEIAYSRMTVTNHSAVTKILPTVSSQLIPLNENAKTLTKIEPGETVVREYAIPADRFGESCAWPSGADLAEQGGFDSHYAHMKRYWNDRLAPLAVIKNLPDERLINAYKAGFIYTMIIRDDVRQADGSVVKELHVGENGYDSMFDHDTIGIVSTLLTLGDYTNAKEYLTSLPAQLQYDDAKWKYSWPYALYLRKTGDVDFIRSRFAVIQSNTHMVETDRIDGGRGVIKKTNAIDSNGYWLTDDWSALTGLATYRYICNQLGEKKESNWAKAEYDDLFRAVTNKLQDTMTKYNLDYIPISLEGPNETGARKDPRDANWASMFLFGRWGWDGYLFGAPQSGIMLDKIDDTYTHGFERRADLTDNPYNFGGYPHGYFSSAYNAGYGSAALRGEEYRDAGIKGYEFMMDHSMSGPFGWWEGVGYPSGSSPWDIDHAATGGGSCQHMWGQSTATKVLFDSLIAEKTDDTVIVGRGIPVEWLMDGKKVEIANYPVKNNKRIGYRLTTTGTTVTIEFTGDVSKVPFSIELMGLKNNIKSAKGLRFDQKKGTVAVPAGTKKVTIQMKKACADNSAQTGAVIKLKQTVATAQAYAADLYTHQTFSALSAALNSAKKLLANENKTAEQVQAMTDQIIRAIQSLAPIDITDTVDFSDGEEKNSYEFGKLTDQFKRYQTFVAPETGTADNVQIKVDTKLGNMENLTDLTAEIYSLKSDNQSLDQLVASAVVKKENVSIDGNATSIPIAFDMAKDKGYALVLGQTGPSDTNCYRWQVLSNSNNGIFFVKWNKNGDGSDKFVDESFLGKGWLKITVFKYSKKTLQEFIENAEKLNQRDYTCDSWAKLSAALASANGVLQGSGDPEEVKAAEQSVSDAVAALVKRKNPCGNGCGNHGTRGCRGRDCRRDGRQACGSKNGGSGLHPCGTA